MGNASLDHCLPGTVIDVEMIEMAWDDDAWDGFCSTKSSAPGLYAQLYAVLARVAGDPGAYDLRRRRLQDAPSFVITVTSGDESWAILWNQAEDGVPQVWFVGPSPF
jgi:hypothetical protein